MHVHALDANHGVATWGRTIIHLWRRETLEKDVREAVRVAQSFIESNRDPVHALIIIEPASSLPGTEARAHYARFSRDIVPRMSAAVAVTEQGGFRAAAIRSVAVAMSMILPHKVPFKFVDTLEQAVELLGPHVPAELGGKAGLREAVLSLRADQ